MGKKTIKKQDKPFRYLSESVSAGSHTPIYKMHRYFARRPHNVFRNLIENYTSPGDIILDPFCGGGVTLVEGLATHRKVVAIDSNPLATFITDSQTTPISVDEYAKVMEEIEDEMTKEIGDLYSTKDRDTKKYTEARWLELAYKVICDQCSKETLLSNELKLKISNRVINGKYACSNCRNTIVSVGAERVGYEIISVTYKDRNGSRKTVTPNSSDKLKLKEFETKKFDNLIKKKKLWYPNDPIPSTWDRQQEDCLHRKSIKKFSDFYTRRALYSNALLLKLIQGYQRKVDQDLYKLLLFTFSAVVRYTNNMTVSAGSWMDGRPVAWAKHAYWIPNQFVEVNPLEYIRMRKIAVISGIEYQKKIIFQNKKTESFDDLISDKGTHIISTQSSEKLSLPNESIDAVITDPPYGSNVQYGELSHYWLVWLQNDLNLKDVLFKLDDEILVHRKTKQKKYSDYEDGIFRVFQESHRVLKKGGVLTFTFNNKDIRSWYAVIRAAIRAGFLLEPEGVIYQDAIENYKNTAHTRFAGSLHGDFIYTFKKKKSLLKKSAKPPITREELMSAIRGYLKENHSATTSELYMVCIQQLIPAMLHDAQSGLSEFTLGGAGGLSLTNLDELLSSNLQFDSAKRVWELSNL